jgi:pyruvate kinase
MAEEVSQLTVDIRPGEQLSMADGRIIVEILDKSGKLARLRVTAPMDMEIKRKKNDQPRAMRDIVAA